MKLVYVFMCSLLLNAAASANSVVDLPYSGESHLQYQTAEQAYFSELWQSPVITNVAKPTITVYRPSIANNTGVAVVVAPGGGFFALSIEKEGTQVAEWLVEKGITVFLLKYRLTPTGKTGVEEMSALGNENPQAFIRRVQPIVPLAIEDGLNAVAHVREQAVEYGIASNKIGFLGFSAGGAVGMGIAYNYNAKNRPDFVALIYPWTDAVPLSEPQPDAPPLFLVCARDDALGLAKGAIALYQSYLASDHEAAMHLYASGGHGFGMSKQGLASDSWIERYYEWLSKEIQIFDGSMSRN